MRGARDQVRALAAICLIALAIRVGYVLVYRTDIPVAGDSYFYSEGADLLVDGQGFLEPASVAAGAPEQSASHPPLYLLYLSVASVLLAPLDLTSHGVAHMLWSCVLGTATVFACGLVGFKLAGRRCGLIAAGIAAVYPGLWVHDGMLLSETAVCFTAAMIVLAAYGFWEHPSGRRIAWLGLWCGLGTLARPELVLSIPLIVAPLLLFERAAAVRQRLAWAAAAGGAAFAAIAPWVAFNFSRFEEPVYISTNFGGVLAASNCDEVYYGDDIGFKNYDCAARYYGRVDGRGLDPSERDKAVRAEVAEYINANRGRLPAVVLARIGRITGLFQPERDIAFDQYFQRREEWVARAVMYSYYALAVLAACGAVLLRRSRIPVFPLLALLVTVLVAVGSTFSQSRYRASAEVGLVLLAAVAVDWMAARLPRRRAASGHRVPLQAPQGA